MAWNSICVIRMLPLCRRFGTRFFFSYAMLIRHSNYSAISSILHPCGITKRLAGVRTRLNVMGCRYNLDLFFSSSYNVKGPSRTLRKRINKRNRAALVPVLDEEEFKRSVSQLMPRFKPEELHDVIVKQEDSLVCLELFNWASKQPRFRHATCTYHIIIKKLGIAKMKKEMYEVVDQALADPSIGSEGLYNTMIYYLTEARKLSRAISVYKHMRKSGKLKCRPTIRTYNLLFAALLSKRSNTYVNHMYMDTISILFKQMVNDGVSPDIYSLNSMIKGYVISLHLNDALRIFHQMGVVYDCQPNAFTYDYLIHGLCAQGRTKNAMEFCKQMKERGYIPSGKSYNSLVNSLAMEGQVDQAENFLWEMIENGRSADLITYKTLLKEIFRLHGVGRTMGLLKELRKKEIVDGDTLRNLQSESQE